jgi:hypothetical protein
MPSGSRPGERRGGRVKGVPNRITLEKARQALEEVDRLKRQGKLYKLGKDRAQDIDDRAYEMAMAYAPVIKDGVVVWPSSEAPQEFERWIRLSLDAAKIRAPYESPRYMAVGVVAPGMDSNRQQEDRADPREVMWQIYKQMRERGELALKAVPAPKGQPPAPAPEPEPAVEDDADGVAV